MLFIGRRSLADAYREVLGGGDPFLGTIYVFRVKRTDRIKLVYWDGTGLCLFAEWLEDGVSRLAAGQFSALLEGLYWSGVHEPREVTAPALVG